MAFIISAGMGHFFSVLDYSVLIGGSSWGLFQARDESAGTILWKDVSFQYERYLVFSRLSRIFVLDV